MDTVLGSQATKVTTNYRLDDSYDKSPNLDDTPPGNGRLENGKITIGSLGAIRYKDIKAHGDEWIELKTAGIVPLSFHAQDSDNFFASTMDGMVTEITDNYFSIVFDLSVTAHSENPIDWPDFVGGTIVVGGGFPMNITAVNSSQNQITASPYIDPDTQGSWGLGIPCVLMDDDSPYNLDFKLPRKASSALMQESDDPRINLFAKAYIRPIHDDGGNTEYFKDVEFIKNVNIGLGHDPLAQLYKGCDTHDIETPAFWVVYIQSAYEPKREWDNDPDSERECTGFVNDIRGLGAFIFFETIFDSAKDIAPDPKAEVVVHEFAHLLEAETVVHEIGHLFGLYHEYGNKSDGTNSGVMGNNVFFSKPHHFSDTSLSVIRGVSKP